MHVFTRRSRLWRQIREKMMDPCNHCMCILLKVVLEVALIRWWEVVADAMLDEAGPFNLLYRRVMEVA